MLPLNHQNLYMFSLLNLKFCKGTENHFNGVILLLFDLGVSWNFKLNDFDVFLFLLLLSINCVFVAILNVYFLVNKCRILIY